MIGLDGGDIYIASVLHSLPVLLIPRDAWRLGRSGACPLSYYQELHGGLGCLPYLWTSLAYRGYQARDRYRIRPDEAPRPRGRPSVVTPATARTLFAHEQESRIGLVFGTNASCVRTASELEACRVQKQERSRSGNPRANLLSKAESLGISNRQPSMPLSCFAFLQQTILFGLK